MPPAPETDTESIIDVAALGYEVRDVEESSALWGQVLEALPVASFYHRWEWFRAVSDHLAPDVEFHWFFEGDRPIAIFPLERAGWRGPLAELRHPVHADIFLRDCLVTAGSTGLDWPTVWALALDAAGDSRGVAAVRHHVVPERSCAMAAFRADSDHVRISRTSTRAYCPVASPDSLERLSAKNLRNVDRLARKAGREAGSLGRRSYLGLEAHTTGLDTFLGVEGAGWKGKSGTATSLSCAPISRAFFRQVLRAFGATGDARVEVLTIGGQPAAAFIMVRAGAQWNMLKIGYDPRFSTFGPGAILLKLFLEQAVEDTGIEEVSLITSVPWAARWHLMQEPTYDFAAFMPSLAGRARAMRHDLLGGAREVRTRLKRSNDA
jgi:CelD/BcsL family acetyltransferase involved in cellulose biosynthesis